MCEGNEPRSGERIFRRSFLEASRCRACASPAYALLQTRHHGLQPWLHSNAAPRLFGLNQISSEYSFFRAGSGVLKLSIECLSESSFIDHGPPQKTREEVRKHRHINDGSGQFTLSAGT